MNYPIKQRPFITINNINKLFTSYDLDKGKIKVCFFGHKLENNHRSLEISPQITFSKISSHYKLGFSLWCLFFFFVYIPFIWTGCLQMFDSFSLVMSETCQINFSRVNFRWKRFFPRAGDYFIQGEIIFRGKISFWREIYVFQGNSRKIFIFPGWERCHWN
jgi:hypothetical protein